MELASDPQPSTFGDLFADVLVRTVGAGGAGAPEPGADLHTALTVSFEEAMRGAERFVVADAPRAVSHLRRGAAPSRCRRPLSGVPRPRADPDGARAHGVHARRARRAAGAACAPRRRAGPAAARASRRAPRACTCTCRPACTTGRRCGFPGAGTRAGSAADPGDLVVSVNVEPHPLFRRDGDDLHLVVPVALHEAALGAKIDIPTFDGPVRLRVPPGTASGQRLRLRERGAPSLRTGGRGDLIVEVRLVMPPMLDERSKELMREFGRINGDDVRQGLWGEQA